MPQRTKRMTNATHGQPSLPSTRRKPLSFVMGCGRSLVTIRKLGCLAIMT
jgi:hypothetical protein